MYLKKFATITATIFLISSCSENVKTSPDTNKDKLTATDKEYDTSKLEPYYIINIKLRIANKFCEPLEDSDLSTKIRNPTNIVVNKAGTEVYVINGTCLPNSDYYKNCLPQYTKSKRIVPRNFIYKITSDKKVEIVKVNNEPPASCNLGYELGIDKEDNLYISNWNNHGIYKITADKKQLVLLDEFKYSKELDSQIVLIPEYQGPIKLSVGDNSITYLVYHPDSFVRVGGMEKTITLDGKNVISMKRLERVGHIINNSKYFFDTNLLNKIPADKPYKESDVVNLGDFKDFCPNAYCNDVFSEIKMNSKKELFLNYNHKKILKLNPETKEISVFIDDNGIGYKDGDKKTAQFNFISNMSFDSNDNLFVSDTNNNAIRKITPDGVVSTFYVEKGGN